MKTRLACLALASAAVCAAQTNNPPVTAPSSGSDETVQLPQFTVSTERANPYLATDSMSTGRIGGALIDTPFTVDVITSDFLNDIGANSLLDASQYLAGMSQGRLGGENGIAERQSIRGFENSGRLIDNFGSGFQAQLDPDLYERVEIVEGPDSVLSPTGSPGGTINVITKSPQFNPATWVSHELGNYFADKATFDSTGPIGQNSPVAYRVVAAYQDAETFVPGKVIQWDFNPQLAWKISDRAQLTVKYSDIHWESLGGASNPGTVWIVPDTVANGAIAPTTPAPGFAYRGENGVPDWADRSDLVQRLAAEFTTAVADNISMRLAACYLYDHMNIDGGQDSFPGQSNRYDPYTGVYTPDYTWALASGTYVPTYSAEYNPLSIARVAQINPQWTHDIQIQNDWAGNFTAGPVSIRPVAGGAYEHTINPTYNETAPLPSIDLYAPPYGDPIHPPASAYTTSADTVTITTDRQLYGYLRFGFLSDRLFLTTGYSRLWVETGTQNLLNGVLTPLHGFQNTYLDGIVIKPISNVAIYADTSTNAALANFNNQPLWQQGKQYEFGFKSTFFDQRLSIDADHFQIRENNLVTPNPVYLSNPLTEPIDLLADQTCSGYEVSVVGGITRNLSVLADATAQTPRDAFGRRPRNEPDQLANLLLKYDFRDGMLKGLGAFMGVNHIGTVAGENPSSSGTQLGVIEQVSFYLPSRTIVNAGAVYRISRYRFNLNLDNLLDTRTVYQASGRFNMTPFPTLTVRFTTTIAL